jgi:S1-C subfamily serine protease
MKLRADFDLARKIWPLAIALFFLLPQTGRCEALDDVTPDELRIVKKAEADRIEAINRVYGAVVAIYGNNRAGGGSGVVFDTEGFALTNHHVVAGAGTSGWGGLADGKLYRWRLIGTDPGGDVAIIQLTGRKEFTAAPIGLSDSVRIGDFAMAMGNPFILAEDQTPTVTLGVVSGTHRFQKGTGTNMLVYGNCIQVDSSINPGNSGGPLFNMQAQIIGINGRGSFKERGRVNVGLGYAISSKQIRNFIPDLLATKIAQHGTLDAQFTDRTGGVICSSINLDSDAAAAGLQLGDRLVSFDGESIKDANSFTNLISTLPADWPARLELDRNGDRKIVWVRLEPLPYAKKREKPQPKPKDGEKKKDEKKKAEIKKDTKKKAAPRPRPKPKFDLTNPGRVRDEKLNRGIARLLIGRWHTMIGVANVSGGAKAFHIEDDVLRAGEKQGTVETVLTTDGRFHVQSKVGGENESIVFDGEHFFRLGEDRQEIKSFEALGNSFVMQAFVLAQGFQKQPFAKFSEPLLEGSGKAIGRRAQRFKFFDEDKTSLYLWLNIFDDTGASDLLPLKAGLSKNGTLSKPSVTFQDWQDVAGVKLPFRREIVVGIGERNTLTIVTRNCVPIKQLPESLNRSDSDASEK